MKSLFFIRELEIEQRPFSITPGAGSGTQRLIFCSEGQGELITENGGSIISAGELLLNPTGKLRSGKIPLRLIQVMFTEELFSPAVAMDREALYVLGLVKLYSKKKNSIVLSRIGAERLTSLLQNMLWEFRERRRGYSWALRLKLIELLITVMRDRKFTIPIRGLKSFSNTHVQDVILYLNSDYMNPITVEDILKFCTLSRSHFHALFKKETGQTLISYLNALRCEKAAELLLTTERTIMEICQETGFNNLSHFYHIFKQAFRMSPRRYRVENAR